MKLIFDDGPGEHTGQILDLLEERKLRASFGVIGKNVAGRAVELERMMLNGHTILNHTMTHPVLVELPAKRVAKELLDCQDVIEDACGVTPVGFRPPYVRHDEKVLGIAARLGFTEMVLDVSVGDYLYHDANELAQAVRGYKTVIALHEVPVTMKALPAILDHAKSLVAA